MKIDGHEVLKTVKSDEKLKLIPVAIFRAILNEAPLSKR